jgi:transposase InsO family protein
MEGLEAEIRRLRAENTKLFEQREVLKKSLGILSEPGQGWLYLVAVLDVFTRQVIGWAMHQILDARLVIAALRMALLQRRPGAALIVHSDRGMQFASAAYRQVLAQHGLIASMSRRGNCYDNAFIESFWSSLKYEVVYHQRFATFAEARNAIFNYIETFYNRTRLHSSLAYRSPIAFESQLTTSHTN